MRTLDGRSRLCGRKDFVSNTFIKEQSYPLLRLASLDESKLGDNNGVLREAVACPLDVRLELAERVAVPVLQITSAQARQLRCPPN